MIKSQVAPLLRASRRGSPPKTRWAWWSGRRHRARRVVGAAVLVPPLSVEPVGVVRLLGWVGRVGPVDAGELGVVVGSVCCVAVGRLGVTAESPRRSTRTRKSVGHRTVFGELSPRSRQSHGLRPTLRPRDATATQLRPSRWDSTRVASTTVAHLYASQPTDYGWPDRRSWGGTPVRPPVTHGDAADSLVGLSVGDALGAQYFMVGRKVDDLLQGIVPPPVWEWTDDTTMACSIFWILNPIRPRNRGADSRRRDGGPETRLAAGATGTSRTWQAGVPCRTAPVVPVPATSPSSHRRAMDRLTKRCGPSGGCS